MNYAIITKVRAMYGKRITDADIGALADCRSVEECAEYLKMHPAYARAFENIDTRNITRSQVELELRREYRIDFERLSKGLSSKDRQFVYLLICSYEPSFIMWSLRNAGKSAIVKAPMASLYQPLINKYSKLNFEALINASTPSDVVNSLAGIYDGAAKRAVRDNGEVDYLTADNEIWKCYFAGVCDFIKKNYAKDDAAGLCGMSIDLFNIKRIYRLRMYFDYSAQEIMPFIIRPENRITDEVITKLCAAKDRTEFAAVLRKTPYKRLASAKDGESLEIMVKELIGEKAERIIHFSSSVPAVIYAYMKCKENEIGRVKTVIESIRYNLSREMIENYVGAKAKAD